eukprot:6482363-Amphidinium_carterae.1
MFFVWTVSSLDTLNTLSEKANKTHISFKDVALAAKLDDQCNDIVREYIADPVIHVQGILGLTHMLYSSNLSLEPRSCSASLS